MEDTTSLYTAGQNQGAVLEVPEEHLLTREVLVERNLGNGKRNVFVEVKTRSTFFGGASENKVAPMYVEGLKQERKRKGSDDLLELRRGEKIVQSFEGCSDCRKNVVSKEGVLFITNYRIVLIGSEEDPYNDAFHGLVIKTRTEMDNRLIVDTKD